MHSVTLFDSSSEYLLTCVCSILKTRVFLTDSNTLNDRDHKIHCVCVCGTGGGGGGGGGTGG
jgi:hypothetical protein